MAVQGYEKGVQAPGLTNGQAYRVVHNVLISHAYVYRLYESDYKQSQGGAWLEREARDEGRGGVKAVHGKTWGVPFASSTFDKLVDDV